MMLRRWYAAQLIGRKLILLACGAGMLSLLLLAAIVAPLWRAAEAEHLLRQEMALRPLLTSALAGPMIERDYATVQEIAAGLLRSKAIDAIEVAGADGMTVVALPAPRQGGESLRSIPLAHGALALGEVRVVFSTEVRRAFVEQLGTTVAAGIFLSLLFALILFRRWSRALAARLARVSAAAHELAAGRYDAELPIDAPDEIGTLAADFNRMGMAIGAAVDALEKSRSEVTAILQSIGDGLIATDAAMRVTLMNPVAEALTGWTDAEARGRGIAEILRIEHGLTGQPAEIPVGRVLETGLVVGLANHTVLVARDGRRLHISDSAAPVHNARGELTGVVMVFRDVSESYRLRSDLDAQRQRLALALKGADLGLWDRDLATDALVVDARWAGMLGYRPEEAPQDSAAWGRMIHPDDLPLASRELGAHLAGATPQYEAEVRVRAKNGSWRWILTRGGVTERDADGRPLRLTGTHLDVTERHAAQEEIARLAFYDPLTDLPNRRLLIDRLKHELVEAHRSGHHGALLYIDLDRFKQVNDARGHAAGDALLREMAARLRRALRESDTVARLGGDEFVALLPDLADSAERAAAVARRVADKLGATLAQPCELGRGDSASYVSASIGIALFPDGARHDCDMLLRQADTAMFSAKEGGRNAVRFFEPAMQQAVEARLALENDLRQALANRQIELHLQAQVAADGRITGAEALLRWHHPERGTVPPSAFIPLAEETGLIEPLGDWTLREAAQLLARFERAGRDLRLSVNVSPRQIRQPDFAARVHDCLAQAGASPARLTLEVTESLLLTDMAGAVARLTELKAVGVRLSLDDFGTGYSSLSYLKRLPLHEIKIDRGFVAGLPQDDSDATLTGVILLIGARMGLEVVAEGIETAAQLDWLKEGGCELFQGYLLARPEPVAAFCARLGMTEN
ncbi:MAG: EAL domain-containing protein [Sulfuritalea sp.]|nr:EAL domain-containing protein [Sulfuritalea sp.]